MDKQDWTQILTNHQQNVLHLAPLCTKNFCKQLIGDHHESQYYTVEKGESQYYTVEKGRITILHSWISNNKVWQFEYILKTKWRSPFIILITARDCNDMNNHFHVAATTINDVG